MNFHDLHFQEKRCEYNQVYTFSFKRDETLSFIAGQWVHLGFPTPERDKSKVRHMSFSSGPEEDLVEFTMDLSSGSWFKKAMGALKKNDVVKAFKVNGDFVVQQDLTKEVIFLIGGIGITPVRSILRDFAAKKSSTQWKLFHVSREAFLYEKELTLLKGEQWRTNRAGLDAIWKGIVNESEKRKYYICGSERFVLGMQQRLACAQITDIVCENFDDQ